MARLRKPESVNNAFYDSLGTRWVIGNDHPVALLRAEAPVKLRFVTDTVLATFGKQRARVLDIGCGAGFLANALALRGHKVTGIDASAKTLQLARKEDSTSRVLYQVGDATRLPFSAAVFDIVCAMDLLEHVDEPDQVVQEAARVVRPGGLFFFHTFNRTWLAWLLASKGLEWFVENTPPRLHVYQKFIKPAELEAMMRKTGLQLQSLRGIRPVLSWPFFQLLATRRVPRDFQFQLSRSTAVGYLGVARRDSADAA